MLTYVFGPVLGALMWGGADKLPEADHAAYIDRCWNVLWLRQRERRGLSPMSLTEVLAYDQRYAWRGTDSRGGGVFGL